MPWPALAARRGPVRARPLPDLDDPDNPSLEIERRGEEALCFFPSFFPGGDNFTVIVDGPSPAP